MNKKLLTFIFGMIFLISILSSASATMINYEKGENGNPNLKVSLKDNFLFIPLGEIGTAELKSHNSVDEVKQVGLGKQVVMWYDFNFDKNYSNALGTPEFIDVKTGKSFEREWKYVYWGEEEYASPIYSEMLSANGTLSYYQTGAETLTREAWLPYNSTDIPEGKIRIGIEVEVKKGDYIDGVWVVCGKKIVRHAEWEQKTVGHGVTQTANPGTTSNFVGFNITLGVSDFYLVEITKATDVTATTARVKYNNMTEISSASFSGRVATFSPPVLLKNNTLYTIGVDSGGISYNQRFGTGTYPVVRDDFNWTSQSSGPATNFYNIESITYNISQIKININLISPEDNVNLTSNDVEFSVNISDPDVLGIQNVTINVYNLTGGLVWNETNTSGFEGVYNFSHSFEEGEYEWNATTYDDSDVIYNSITRSFNIDSTLPQIDISAGNGTLDYGTLVTNHTINYTITDTNLNSCWLQYNSTNTTIPCTSGMQNSTSFALQYNVYNATIWANDTFGNEESLFFNWDYKIFENGRWLNSSTYETATENYIISLSSNSSLTNVYLNYSNNSIPTTSSSGNWTYSRDAPIGTIGNQTINWIATYSGENISIPIYSYQNVLETVFTICNATYTNDALNLTFKDEANLNYINATIPTSTWTYYLGSGAVNKTYTYSSTTEQMNYVFCSSVDRNLNVNPYVQFKKGTDYPQRIWEPSTKQYNQSVIEQTLYLLSSTDGIYVTYQVLDGTGTQIGGVDVVAKRTINGEEFIVGIGQTDAAGAITFWMNPDFVHSITFSKEGYTTYTLNQFPTQTIYTITIGQTSGGDVTDYLRGITYQIKPPFGQTLNASQLYNFNMTFNSSYWELDSFGFEIYGDNVLIGANSSTNPTGGYLQNILNISNYEHISMEIYWIINGTLTYGRNDGWFVFNYDEGTEWSVLTFFKDLSTYTDTEGGNGIFGLNQNSLNLIIFIIIFLVTGLVSYKFSVTSPAVVSGIIFAMVFLFDVGLGMIKVNVFGGVQYFPTIFMLIIMVALIIKEATQ